MSSKFDSEKTEAAYEISLNGCCDEVGNVDEGEGWFAKIDEMLMIINETGQGFVYGEEFETEEELEARWQQICDIVNYEEE